ALDRMGGDANDPSAVGEEIPDRHGPIVGSENKTPYPSSFIITLKVGVLVLGRKIVALVPCPANRTGSLELRTGNGRTRTPDVGDCRQAVGGVNAGARGPGVML